MKKFFVQSVRHLWWGFQLLLSYLIPPRRCECGHMCRWKTRLVIDGEPGLFTRKDCNYCAQCFAKAAIKCAWCGKSIVPGSPITLYLPKEGASVPGHAVPYKEMSTKDGRHAYVGCLRWECADTGADRAGFWVMPGKVRRVLSVFEQVMLTNDVIIVGDVSDPAEAVPFPDKGE